MTVDDLCQSVQAMWSSPFINKCYSPLTHLAFTESLHQRCPQCSLCCLIIGALEELQGVFTHNNTQILKHECRVKFVIFKSGFSITVVEAVYRGQEDVLHVCACIHV